jgi:putative NAD(P)-binding protein
MPTRTIETDYLVVGSGAAGMAFTDALIADSRADVVIVDRRHAPGGHWHDAYAFVRLHQPSAYYGANSVPLGSEAIDRHGPNQGLYERASAPEICAYYDRIMQQQLLPSGRVRYFPMCEYVGNDRFVSRLSGDQHEVKVRRKRVDARYLEPFIPATSRPPFETAADARCIPINDLSRSIEHADRFSIVGAGKTAIDACLWLLEAGVSPDAIRWIKPRESWLLNRVYAQGGELVGTLFEGLSFQIEAAAHAASVDDLMDRLNATAQLLRVDDHVRPTMYRGATVSAGELEQLRRIRDVVRLGRVRRIERAAVVLNEGRVAAGPRDLHVHCAASGLNPAPDVPIFSANTITLQPVRTGLIPFNAALVGFVEATFEDDAEKNRLCPPNRMPNVPLDWVRGTLIGTNADYLWSKNAAIARWLERARLNPSRGLRLRMHESIVQQASKRYAAHIQEALVNLQRLSAQTADCS